MCSYLAQDMRGMFVDQGLGGVTKKEFRYNEQSDILLAVQSLLQNVAPIAIGSQLYDATPINEV